MDRCLLVASTLFLTISLATESTLPGHKDFRKIASPSTLFLTISLAAEYVLPGKDLLLCANPSEIRDRWMEGTSHLGFHLTTRQDMEAHTSCLKWPHVQTGHAASIKIAAKSPSKWM